MLPASMRSSTFINLDLPCETNADSLCVAQVIYVARCSPFQTELETQTHNLDLNELCSSLWLVDVCEILARNCRPF